jgi:predicted nucleic acid-binding protein
MSRTVEPRPLALLDTSAYFALASSRESRHADAQRIADRLQAERWRLFTTNYVVAAKTHALLLIRVNRAVAAQFLDQIDRSPTTISRATRADEQRARSIITQY